MRQDSRAGKLTSQGAKDHRATQDLHYDPGQLRPAGTIPGLPADRRPDAHRVPQLLDAGRPGRSIQARPHRHKREAAGMTAAPRAGRHDRSDRHRDLKQGFILVMAKVPSRSPANAMN
jgi:hypothetical protein